jgi:threonine/homoserine/homoserine lactone efflux protein
MENLLGELWIFKLTALIGAGYLVYMFIKDRMRKK